MAIALRPSAGTKVYVSAAAPATMDLAGYSALSFTEVKGFDSVSEIGDAMETGNFDSLTEGRIKYRSINDPGELESAPADLPADPGQVLLKAGFDAPRGDPSELLSIQIEDETGLGTYFQCIVSKWSRTFGGAADIVIRNVTMPISAGSVVEY